MESVDKGCRVKETQICEMDKNLTLFPPPQREVKVKVKDERYMKAWVEVWLGGDYLLPPLKAN